MTSTKWIQAITELCRDNSEQVEQAFLDAGAVSVTLQDAADQPILEPGVGETPLWDRCILKALFPAATNTEITARKLVERLPANSEIRWQLLEDKDWSQAWKKYFKPIACAQERLWICPSWTQPPNPKAVNLLLDPGLAFGTGSHPTTLLCLNWLEQQPLAGKTLIDFGCGSGILGIAALLLGATQVWGIDNDPQALLASRDNAERNGLSEHQLITLSPEDIPAAIQADVVVANILAEPLIGLAEQISNLVRPAGRLCLSGILHHQIEAVTQPYQPYFEFDPVIKQDEWVQLSATHTASCG